MNNSGSILDLVLWRTTQVPRIECHISLQLSLKIRKSPDFDQLTPTLRTGIRILYLKILFGPFIPYDEMVAVYTCRHSGSIQSTCHELQYCHLCTGIYASAPTKSYQTLHRNSIRIQFKVTFAPNISFSISQALLCIG